LDIYNRITNGRVEATDLTSTKAKAYAFFPLMVF